MTEYAVTGEALFTKACEIFDGDTQLAQELFNTKIPALGNIKPNQLLKTSSERKSLSEYLHKLEHGEYS
ncbi:DUF2384 domain-containing protein [Alginatibacterium sediminis]|uniref:DUF2384 domain-containing protein n=1 Tax=Alginatibacterium sediminis TaxID=2164068 RepID=A0A420EDS7_9ALTE|nr:antitoxin Xre/MbcA/ParS toxin-binding domain-containing protein [Alginatibacterium sediminis]RKF18835.1 DUF2384 domain-containing protein [Alginatibacterium sediminis]